MNTTANTPFELFFDQLRHLHDMEVQLCESTPRLVSLCTNAELRDLIASHAKQNRNQVAEIAAIIERHGESLHDGRCSAMAELIEGGTAQLEGVRSTHTRDLMLVAQCLRIECYEMASYEFTTLLSGRLGLLREPAILSDLLAEEKDMATALKVLEPDLFETANFQACGGSSTTAVSPSFWRRFRLAGQQAVSHKAPSQSAQKLFFKLESNCHGPGPHSLSQ